jgi:hypothetical protein
VANQAVALQLVRGLIMLQVASDGASVRRGEGPPASGPLPCGCD